MRHISNVHERNKPYKCKYEVFPEGNYAKTCSSNSFMKKKNYQHKIQTTSVKYVMKFASKRSMVRHKLEIHDKEKLCQCSIHFYL